jgi:hypothetical protein
MVVADIGVEDEAGGLDAEENEHKKKAGWGWDQSMLTMLVKQP